jgi:uncharacterized protein YecE (DUF72 family)
MTGAIRVGIGGWSYPPWRGVFYPKGVRQADELAFASRALRVIEINSTFQSFQTPGVFAGWAERTPEDFIFTVKAHRLCTNRKVLADAGEAVERFLGQGLTELGGRLGPILWQLAHTKAFDPVDFGAFLDLLPDERAGRRLRHAVEVRHPSFADPAAARLCEARGVAICLLDHPTHPPIDEPTADFTYARLISGRDEIETGYPPEELDSWARRLRLHATGDGARGAREVFAFFINAGKLRAPAAAMALAERIDRQA